MGLDVWLQEDIAESIVAVTVGMLCAAAAHGVTNVEYCRGVLDSARAHALNYRIPWAMLRGKLRAALSDIGHEEMLNALAESTPAIVYQSRTPKIQS